MYGMVQYRRFGRWLIYLIDYQKPDVTYPGYPRYRRTKLYASTYVLFSALLLFIHCQPSAPSNEWYVIYPVPSRRRTCHEFSSRVEPSSSKRFSVRQGDSAPSPGSAWQRLAAPTVAYGVL